MGFKARQGKARQGKARQGKARQGKARQGKAVDLHCGAHNVKYHDVALISSGQTDASSP